MPSTAPIHALGLAELDTGVGAQRLGEPLARDMEMSQVQVSHKRNAVQTGLPVEHGAKDTAPYPHLGAELLSHEINQATDVFKELSRCDPKQVYLVPTRLKPWRSPSASVLQPPALHC